MRGSVPGRARRVRCGAVRLRARAVGASPQPHPARQVANLVRQVANLVRQMANLVRQVANLVRQVANLVRRLMNPDTCRFELPRRSVAGLAAVVAAIQGLLQRLLSCLLLFGHHSDHSYSDPSRVHGMRMSAENASPKGSHHANEHGRRGRTGTRGGSRRHLREVSGASHLRNPHSWFPGPLMSGR
ncbi:hypothetical protein [Phytoactinopolyspora halophila]|uniref:hypothetical protein n=1 Tax=Phytoactinopolyspora halophila TaxID=1981511 RepID=UPI0013DE2818|nr:hypothetical protein [Phytoactinopolyspora halophila]